MANLSSIYNSGSLYEQLISQVIAIESQPRLKLKAEQGDQNVYKGVLSDFSSKVSALDSALDKLQDPLRNSFQGRAATVGADAGFKASASDDAATGTHQIRVDRLAQADARLSKQVASTATDLADLFLDAGDPPAPSARSFTIHIAQDDADPVDLEVSYTPPDDATNDDVLAGISRAINAAVHTADTDGRLAKGTGASASVVHETSGTSRLTLRSLATGYGNRLTFSDPDGLLAEMEVSRTDVRTGTGGGAVVAVGSGPADSDLTSAFSLDGLTIYRDTNTVDDAVDGLSLTLSAVTEEPATVTVGSDVKGMRTEVEAFIKAYNGLATFLTTKTKVDADTGARGAFAGDAAIRGLRYGLRSDLARPFSGAGDLKGLADLGITTERDGTLKLSDATLLEEALADSPDTVGTLFSGEDGVAARLADRIGGLIGSFGTIAQRKKGVDASIKRIDSQIKRLDNRLALREEMLRSQFARLEEMSTQAQTQSQSLTFYY